jgi:hypothetical protein
MLSDHAADRLLQSFQVAHTDHSPVDNPDQYSRHGIQPTTSVARTNVGAEGSLKCKVIHGHIAIYAKMDKRSHNARIHHWQNRVWLGKSGERQVTVDDTSLEQRPRANNHHLYQMVCLQASRLRRQLQHRPPWANQMFSRR